MARCLDGAGGEGLGGFVSESQQSGHGGAVAAAVVAERHAGVAEQVEPGDEVDDGGREDGLLVEHVLGSALLEQAGEFGGARSRLVEPARR